MFYCEHVFVFVTPPYDLHYILGTTAYETYDTIDLYVTQLVFDSKIQSDVIASNPIRHSRIPIQPRCDAASEFDTMQHTGV